MGTTQKITTEFTADGFGIIRMLNGQNRLNIDFLTELNSALDRVLSNKDCKALITTSEGKFYSNGIDLDWLLKQPEVIAKKFSNLLHDTLWRIMHFPLPTVAALNGHTFAGGAFVAISHDYRVMSGRSTKVWNLDAMREAVVFGRRITAPEAKTLSLVDSVVELDKLIPEAKRLAKHALGNNDIDRNALTMMKSNTYVRKILSSKL
ncbi:ECI1_2 [Mytilus edulis]|uniref:ECI1_2 n=1 Tax=Mytilus edulis TaxID=6550 RepID=A0A8S3R2L3_MYTED|nr:ECI1_2 [Mytilus edulis]